MTTTTQNTIDISRYNGFITVHNPATGGHRTFRIHTVRRGGLKGKRVIGLLIGSDNTADYRGFGFVGDDGRVRLWKRFRGTVYESLSRIMSMPDWYAEHKGIEFSFSARCRKCNRDLTDPTSIELGIGPVCRGEM